MMAVDAEVAEGLVEAAGEWAEAVETAWVAAGAA